MFFEELPEGERRNLELTVLYVPYSLDSRVWTGEPICNLSRNKNRSLEYGERRCGLNTKHQNTKTPDVANNAPPAWSVLGEEMDAGGECGGQGGKRRVL